MPRANLGERERLSFLFGWQKNDDATCPVVPGRLVDAWLLADEQDPREPVMGGATEPSNGGSWTVHLTNRTSNANKQPPIAGAISFAEAKAALPRLPFSTRFSSSFFFYLFSFLSPPFPTAFTTSSHSLLSPSFSFRFFFRSARLIHLVSCFVKLPSTEGGIIWVPRRISS